MKSIIRVSMVVLFAFSFGCVDGRTKRAASLLNVKTQVATKEYVAAGTVEDKVKVADEYFGNAADFTQVLDDYLHGRKPADATK